jgi:hypothetical protein
MIDEVQGRLRERECFIMPEVFGRIKIKKRLKEKIEGSHHFDGKNR